MKQQIVKELKESITVKEKLIKQSDSIALAAKLIISALRKGNKILLFGNGGSAADCQHIAAEIVGRYKKERRAYPAISLTTDTSILTALGNDYSFDGIFARQIQALGKKNDIALGISTSGNSPNVAQGLLLARKLGLKTIALTGCGGGRIKKIANLSIGIPSNNTPRIQEAHIVVAHIICGIVEENLV